MDDMQVYIANLGKYNEGWNWSVRGLPFPLTLRKSKRKSA